MASPLDIFYELMSKESGSIISNLIEIEFEKEVTSLNALQDQAVTKFKLERAKLTNKKQKPPKRKLEGIDEGYDEDGTKKKSRPSREKLSKMELVIDKTFALENHQHSTPNKDPEVTNQTIQVDDTMSVDKPRTKRNASVLATVMNNKLLNEKLNNKMRRPGSREINNQDLLLDKSPYVLLNDALKNNNMLQKSSLPKKNSILKNGLTIKMDTTSLVEIMNAMSPDKENNPNTMNVEDVTLKINSSSGNATLIKHGDVSMKSVSPSTVLKTRNTQSAAINLTDDSTQNENDATIMPPPVMPIKKSKRGRPCRTKKTNNDTAVDSEDNNEVSQNTSTRSCKNVSSKIVDTSKVADESMGRCTRITRASSRNNISMEPPPPPPPLVEKPKRTRTKKGKAATINKSEPVAETVEITIGIPQIKLLSRVECSSSDEEFEQKKKQRPKRTRKGKKTATPKPASPPPAEEIPDVADTVEKRPSNDSGVSSSGRSKAAEENEKTITPVITNDGEVENPTNSMRSSNRVRSKSNSVVSSPHTPKNDSYVVMKQEPPNSKKKTALNETRVLENSKGLSRETIVINSPKQQQHHPDVQPSKILNETVTLPSRQLDQTITITKGQFIQCDPNESLLTDDLSEVEETPPPPQNKPGTKKSHVSKIFTKGFTNLRDLIAESPVKSRVQHFERLAEAAAGSPKVTVVDGPTRVTRTKTRAMAAKESVLEEIKEPKPEPPPPSRKISKLATPISARTIAQLKLPLPVPSSKQTSVKLGPSRAISADSLLSPKGKYVPFVQVGGEDDALRKKDAILQARVEEKKKKREERSKAAAQAREQQEKLKKANSEREQREREEKNRQIQMEREEKIREDAEWKRYVSERKAAELEGRRKLDEALRVARLQEQEEEARRIAHAKAKQQKENEILRKKVLNEEKDLANARKLQEAKSQSAVSKLLGSKKTAVPHRRLENFKTFEELGTDDESEDEKHTKRVIPTWTRQEHRRKQVKVQSLLKPLIIDTFYSTTKFTPNLADIFPKIEKRKLVRSSSAHWRTPPRYSMMPKEE